LISLPQQSSALVQLGSVFVLALSVCELLA
jgi:hypothetical protein